MTPPKILVTGATERAGAAVVVELVKAGYPVRALVRRDDGRANGGTPAVRASQPQ